ncbi:MULTISPECIES: hypothetical protein [unclassified Streptomyces]|uniref:hypothetical protein n=1 Tax=unclassified Streptomyces TaxID=2593676 RepID=UPI0011AA7748|nr:hypothetical protein [Streptomyces sp. BK340]TVZ94132.1 hypothetical protein FB157_105199 [Streptomyces sp. BK340]
MRRIAVLGAAIAAALAIVTGATHQQEHRAQQAGDAGWQRAASPTVLADAQAAPGDAGWQ